MFGSDKRTGFLTGTPGGAVTRTPKKTGPALTSTGSGPVTSLPNPVVPSNPAPKGVAEARGTPVRTPPVTPTAPAPAATRVPTRQIPSKSLSNRTGEASFPAPKANPGIRVDRFGKVMSPGRGLWSHLTSQMTPGKWFNRG